MTSEAPKCPKCNRGAEVCDYCHDIPRADWEAICDCGLFDFGRHLISCSIVSPDFEVSVSP